jgi:hypothetical protein
MKMALWMAIEHGVLGETTSYPLKFSKSLLGTNMEIPTEQRQLEKLESTSP